MWSINQYINPGPVSIVFKLQQIEWKSRILYKNLNFEVMKNSTQKRSTYIERVEKPYETASMILQNQDLMASYQHWNNEKSGKPNICQNR